MFVLHALMLCLASRSLAAQGITSAAVEGTVTRADGVPIDGATVRVTDAASGAHWQAVTDEAGRYFLENVRVGGPYVLDAMAMGLTPSRSIGVVLTLGQRYRADFLLAPAVVRLGAVTVSATVDQLGRTARTGPEHVVTEATIRALPNVSRDISAAVALAPLAMLRPLGGVSIGGQNQAYNSLQVDGGVNADLYLGRTPGGASASAALPEVLPHTISIETVREVQVLASPFDVRFGGFAGGLLNVVTKSGTNDFHGALFGFIQDGRLAARDLTGRPSVFTTRQFGGTLAGPIVRDRIHFFVNADVQQRVVADAGPLVTDTLAPRTLVPYDSALRFQNVLRASGVDPGSLGPNNAHLPAQDLFAKLTFQLGDVGHLELSQRYAHADRRGFLDVTGRVDTVPLSSVAGRSRSTARTSRAIWTTSASRRIQNEAIVSYARLRDSCRPNGILPRIQVLTNSGYLLAGPNPVCPTTAVDQSALELTENLTAGAGPHLVTIGSHAELLHFRDPLVQVSAGRWYFDGLGALEAGTASHYDRGLPSARRPYGVRFQAVTVGLYAQDRWAATPRLTLTPGVRFDVPFLPDPVASNSGLEQTLAINTARLPSGNVLWSPRVGINYRVGGLHTTVVRGGVGLFGGAPPYRWLGNAYRESGDESVVNCDDSLTPRFVPGAAQPATCTNLKGVTPRISYFDPGFKLPQNVKLAVGAERDVGAGVSATLDLLYTRALHQLYISDANLGAPIGVASGEGGRRMYGTFNATTGRSIPQWRSATFGEIYRLSNGSGDESVSLSAQLDKHFGDVLSFLASYSWSRARDRMSLVNFPSRANFSNTPLDGALDARHLRPSFFETPHKVSLGATLNAPLGLQLALIYLGASQPPFTYVVDGDVNADNIGRPGSLYNDAIYIPKNAADVDLVVKRAGSAGIYDPAPASAYARLNAFIDRQPCLREQRGRIMKRNSCRNGWLGLLNARVSEIVPAVKGDRVEIIADVFNLPRLIRARWGRYRDVTTEPSVPLLRLWKWDGTAGRGKYELKTLSRSTGDDTASRWQVQLGMRYRF